MDINKIINDCKEQKGSDVHFVFGHPIKVRVHGSLINYSEDILNDNDCIQIALQLTGNNKEALKLANYDFAISTHDNTRLRVNIFHQQKHISIAIRILNSRIPDISELGLPSIVSDFSNYHSGLILVTGETGSGKSTTLAALLNRINQQYYKHIITIEDPIEYIYEPDKCLINQREIGTDVSSFEEGLSSMLREDPDIILIGEMRNKETIEAALTAAETGHLVFATLHTASAAQSIDRIVCVFPANQQPQIRMQLSTTLKACVSQRLIPHRSGTSRVLACEIMVVNNAISNLIREGKTPQINNSITTGGNDGSISMTNCLTRLVNEGKISKEYLNAFVDPLNTRERNF